VAAAPLRVIFGSPSAQEEVGVWLWGVWLWGVWLCGDWLCGVWLCGEWLWCRC